MFAGSHALHAVDVDSGRTEVLLEAGKRYVEAYDRVVKTDLYEATYSRGGKVVIAVREEGPQSG